jgi:hypothetical protein
VSRRAAAGCLAGVLTVVLIASCGGGTPNSPGPIPQPPPTPPANSPPVIDAITIGVERAEVTDDVVVTATVHDAETAVNQLQYAWSADGGTFSGEGASVKWRPPADRATPAEYVMRLTVTETYGLADASGVRPKNVVTGASTNSVRVHNSPKEVGDMSLGFLREFATSSIPADIAVRDFSDNCSGKAAERSDISDNRHNYEVLASSLTLVNVSIAASRLTGSARIACGFTSRIKACTSDHPNCLIGSTEKVQGECVLNTVYEQRRWWLCSSAFENGVQLPSMRGFFGAHR